MMKYDDYSNYAEWSEEFDEQEIEELTEVGMLAYELNISDSEIWARINKCLNGDLDTRHNQILNILLEIREEYNLD